MTGECREERRTHFYHIPDNLLYPLPPSSWQTPPSWQVLLSCLLILSFWLDFQTCFQSWLCQIHFVLSQQAASPSSNPSLKWQSPLPYNLSNLGPLPFEGDNSRAYSWTGVQHGIVGSLCGSLAKDHRWDRKTGQMCRRCR